MARRLIGTAVTDANGEATITYTGTGAGQLNVVAESGTFVSETYSLYDCIFYDDGVTEKTDNGFVYNVAVQLSVDGTGTTVTNTETSTGRTYWANLKNTSKTVDLDWDSPVAVECDIINGSDLVAFQFGRQADSQIVSRTLTQLGLTNGGHLKFTFDGTNARYFVNNSNTALFTVPLQISDLSAIRFYCPASSTFKYKNFMIYPI